MSLRFYASLFLLALSATANLVSAAEPVPAVSATELSKQVADAERAFAKTMADRDHTAFASFVSEEAVFFSGPTTVLRGRKQVAEGWKPLYEKPAAPFSWGPEKVEVLDSGKLALSTGPVHDPSGKVVGKFTSIWRLEEPGKWRVVFDKGCDVCQECDKKQ